jgi:hypothetical protein
MQWERTLYTILTSYVCVVFAGIVFGPRLYKFCKVQVHEIKLGPNPCYLKSFAVVHNHFKNTISTIILGLFWHVDILFSCKASVYLDHFLYRSVNAFIIKFVRNKMRNIWHLCMIKRINKITINPTINIRVERYQICYKIRVTFKFNNTESCLYFMPYKFMYFKCMSTRRPCGNNMEFT